MWLEWVSHKEVKARRCTSILPSRIHFFFMHRSLSLFSYLVLN